MPVELGGRLGMSKNMIHRALVVLEAEGFVIRAAGAKGYQLGPKILTFAAGLDDESDDVSAICRPYLEELSALSGESVFLGIIVGNNRVLIDKIEGSGRRVAHSQRGLAVPLHVGKASRVLLAHLTDAEIEALPKFHRYSPEDELAVAARTLPGVNPKGACIGPMGARVRGVMSELHGEKIDIIDWSDDPATFVGNALSPAKVVSVTVLDARTRTARVVVPDFQLSLAIGKEGQNARLAARLTGWRIDIRSDEAPAGS